MAFSIATAKYFANSRLQSQSCEKKTSTTGFSLGSEDQGVTCPSIRYRTLREISWPVDWLRACRSEGGEGCRREIFSLGTAGVLESGRVSP